MPEYNCNYCKYKTNRKSSYDVHLKGGKHKLKVSEEHNKSINSELNILKIKMEELACKNAFENSANKQRIDDLNTTINKLNDEKVSILENALHSSHTALQSTNSALQSSHSALNKSLDTIKSTGKTNRTSMSIMQYLVTNCNTAPNLNELDVENTLQLTSAQCKAIIHNPNYIAEVILEKYFKSKSATEVSYHCIDSSRKKFLSKEHNNWTVDIGGAKIKKYIIVPIANKVYDFNEDFFAQLVENIGGYSNLTDTQLHFRGKSLESCQEMLRDRVQDIIIKKLTTCKIISKNDLLLRLMG
jgi:hypothetical protein